MASGLPSRGNPAHFAGARVTLLRVVAIILALLHPTVGHSGKPDVAAGSRVRLSTDDGVIRSSIGLVESVVADTLVVRLLSESMPRVLPFGSISKLELSTGRKGHFWSGVGTGLVLGAVAGGAIGTASAEGGSDWDELNVVFGFGAGAVGGVILGGVVGALIMSERWTRVGKINGIRLGVRAADESSLVGVVSLEL